MAFDIRSLRAGLILCLLLGTLALMASLATPSRAADEYRIGAADILTISMWGYEGDSLSLVDVQVRPDGKISYPIAGEIYVVGMTPLELQNVITKALASMYKDPRVTVLVKKIASNTFSVLGDVRLPGSYDLLPGMTIKDALARAGGLIPSSDRPDGTLVRKDGTRIPLDLEQILEKANPDKEVNVQAGDSIIITAVSMVSILGAVQHPATFPLREGANLSACLARAGGVLENADLAGSFINRSGKTIPVDLKALLIDKDQTVNVPLEPGDIVNVPTVRSKVTVYGAVNRPGTYQIIPGEKDTLMDAISMAGGPAPDARLDRIRVLRPMPDGTKHEMVLNLAKGGPAANIQLAQGDYIEINKKKAGMSVPSMASFGLTLFYLIRGLTGKL